MVQNESGRKLRIGLVRLTEVGSLSEPGTVGTPVMKSFVSNGRSTMDRLHDGIRLTGSRSKCTGIKMTGICAIFFMQPDAANVCNMKFDA